MKINVRVIPNSQEFGVKLKEGVLEIKSTKQPEKGAINREIVIKLSKILEAKVVILRGLKSRNKIIEVIGNEEEIKKRISTINN
ncbi:MAG TPA: DUF167 domain-containing protein [Candidatus Bilamarchaeaceae archaeon]|nr:DUF167 domain-containing protein [Candidatus Bilamarchaeaceae archaeon]